MTNDLLDWILHDARRIVRLAGRGRQTDVEVASIAPELADRILRLNEELESGARLPDLWADARRGRRD